MIPPLPGIIKMITLPNGLQSGAKAWTYQFSVCLQFAQVDQAELHLDKLFKGFPVWIKTLAARSFTLDVQAVGAAAVVKSVPIQLRHKGDWEEGLWNQLFNAPRKTNTFSARKKGRSTSPLFTDQFAALRKQYMDSSQAAAGQPGDTRDGEAHHFWSHARLNYLLGDQPIEAADMKVQYGVVKAVKDRIKKHHDQAGAYHSHHQSRLAPAGGVAFDPFKVLSFLVDKYEINRRLGLILDFELPDSSDLDPFFASGQANVKITMHAGTQPAGALDGYVDNSLYSQLNFHAVPGPPVKRLICMNPMNSAGVPQTALGVLNMKDSLVTKTEILNDALSNGDKAYSLSLHPDVTPGSAATAWAEPLLVHSNPGVTKGLYLYLPNLAGYVGQGSVPPAAGAPFQENHVLLGHKVGVIREWNKDGSPGNIHSLCAKTTSYSLRVVGGQPVDEAVAEGAIRSGTGVGTRDDAGNDAVTINEKAFLWTGESLVVSGIFSALTTPAESSQNDVASDINRQVLQQQVVTNDSYLAMPRLRFGQSYAFVVANVLLNGWSIPFSANPAPAYQKKLDPPGGQATVMDLFADAAGLSAGAYISQRRYFSRLEPVGSPVFVPQNADYPPGESLTHLIARDAGASGQTSIRFVVPRSVSGEQAVWHGALDGLGLHTIRQYIDGAHSRSLATLEKSYPDIFGVTYLGDPLAINIAFAFYLDPGKKIPADSAMIVNLVPDSEKVMIRSRGHYILVYNAFDPDDWPEDYESWKLEVQPGDVRQANLLVVNFSIDRQTVRLSVKPGAELFCEAHFLFKNGDKDHISGQAWRMKSQKIFCEGMDCQQMGTGDFIRQKKAFYPAADFTLTHAMRQPVLAPAFLAASANNIIQTALLGIRQMTFPGDPGSRWSVPFDQDNDILPAEFFPPVSQPYLTQTQIKILDFVAFEHLNGELMLLTGSAAGDQSSQLAKTGTLRVFSQWNEYIDDSGAPHPNGYASPKVIPQQFEYVYELSFLKGNDAASTAHCDDLQLRKAVTDKTYKLTGAANPAGIFTCWASKLTADIDQRDAKFRKKMVSLQGGSKFTYAYKNGTGKPLAGPSTMLIVPCNVKPATVSLHKIMPLIDRWQPDDYTYIKKGNSFRLYLDTGWWDTGAEERLGVMCVSPGIDMAALTFAEYEHYFSKIGRDITSSNDKIDNGAGGLLKTDDFVEFFQQSCAGNTIESQKGNLIKAVVDNWPQPMLVPLEEVHPGLCCWIVTPRFDDEEKKWYVDITVKEDMSNAAHAAFLQLNLVRFQPFGLNYNEPDNPSAFIRKLFSTTDPIDDGYKRKEGDPVYDPLKDFRISPLLQSHTFYLHPTRKISVSHTYKDEIDHLTIRVDLDARTVKRVNGALLSEFWVCQTNRIGTDVDQVDEGSFVQLNPVEGQGSLFFSAIISNFTNRILLKEFECYNHQEFEAKTKVPIHDRNRREVFSQYMWDPKGKKS